MNKKILIGIGSGLVVFAIILLMVFKSTNKPGEENEDVDLKDTTIADIEETLEYGDDITDKTFIINTEDGEKEANFADLEPEVDTMKVGKTEHELELDGDKFKVTIKIEDTQKPVINGVEETIELKGEKVDVEKELAKMITAEDPVDGELEVTFVIEKKEDKENEYNVTAEATDNNGNKTTEKFEVIVKIEEKEKEAKKSNEDSKSTAPTASKSNESSSNNKSNVTSNEKKSSNSSSNKSSSSSSSSKSSSSNKSSSSSSSSKSETKAPSKPKQEKPKQEKPKQEKPKNNSGSNNSGTGTVGENNAPKYPPLNNPSGLPSGAKLISKESPTRHVYSYSRSLPGGGKITQVSAISAYESMIIMKGKDNDGNDFMTKYTPARGVVEHYVFGAPPKFTDDDIWILYEVGEAFARAYKMN